MMETIERTILRSLLHSDEYIRRVLPFLKSEYFTDQIERRIFDEVHAYIGKYNTPPTREAISISLGEASDITETQHTQAQEILNDISKPPSNQTNQQWIIDESEKFCKDKALFNAVMQSIQIIDEKQNKGKISRTAIPELMREALSVCFDSHIGHDYIEDSDDRYEFYHRTETKIPFGLEYFNKITNGGITKKTLNVVMAGTGVGKSLFMCDYAAHCLSTNLNVLYITCEMSEERIAERIDANLLNLSMEDLHALPKEQYRKKIEKLKQTTKGKLIVKEYPTATATALHFRHLLDELRLKKNFVPDIIYIDYLNICASVRYKPGANVNSYTYVKAVAEELRGLAIEKNVPIVTATQSNRAGFSSSDPGLEDTSESFGLPATADLMFVLVATEELDELNQIMVKQLKNRYNDLAANRKFLVGIDRAKMKLYDLDDKAQNGLIDTAGDRKSTGRYQDSFRAQEDLGEDSYDRAKKHRRDRKDGQEKFSTWKV